MPKTKGVSAVRARRRLFGALGMTVCSLLIVTVLAGFVFIGNGIRTGSGLAAAVISSILVDLTNQDRSTNQLGALTVNPVLVAAAQAKANDMAAKGYFAHVSPDGKDPWYWFRQQNYSFNYAGENLAVDFSDSSDVETAWMNSPKHRENILDTHFTQIGIATAVGYYEGRKTTFVVQEFGTPATVAIVQPVTNVTTPKAATDIAIATTQKPATSSVAGAAIVTAPTPAADKNAAVLGETAPAPLPQDAGLLARIWNVILGTPKLALRYTYYAFGAFILLAMLVETGFEIRRHHIRHAVAALALLVLMVGLFSVASTYLFSSPVLVDSGAATTV